MTVQEFYPIYLQNPEICTDSRKARPGAIFFALRGDQFNGNDYVEAALQQGCSWAVVDDPKALLTDKTILVPDSLNFLQELARYHRSQLKIPVLGLTGTNGKTTTKELIAAVLSRKYKVIATQGNLNNHIGVPLTLLRANADTEILVVEMGANHEGEIRFLAALAQPNCGLITNIGRAHLEGFGSFEGVQRAKSELYQHLNEKGGLIFVNQEDEILMKLLSNERIVVYGAGSYPSFRATLKPDFRLSFDLDLSPLGIRETFSVSTQLVGPYNLPNALAALAVGSYFGVTWTDGVQALEAYEPGMNRSEFRITSHNQLILDAYNANPSSMKLALQSFSLVPDSEKLAILGDMRELGTYASEMHQEILEMALKQDFEFILVGPEFAKIAESYSVQAYLQVDDLLKSLQENPIRGKTILLKASRGLQLEKLVPYL